MKDFVKNNKFVVIGVCAAVVLLIVIALIGTIIANSQPKGLVGRWEAEGYSSFAYIFEKENGDHEFKGSYEAYGGKRNFTYEDKGDSVSIKYDGDTTAGTYKYRIEDNKKLIIADSFGSEVTYLRK